MAFAFSGQAQITPTNSKRLSGEPAPSQTFGWWKYAKPQPEYTGCVVKVVEVEDDNHIKIAFYDPGTGTLLDREPVWVDLTDVQTCWSAFPSTIRSPLPIVPEEVGLLCLTDDWLTKVVPELKQKLDSPTKYFKTPYAQEGWVSGTSDEK